MKKIALRGDFFLFFLAYVFNWQYIIFIVFQLSVSLNLNEEIRLFVRKRLRDFASQNPQSKFKIVCWIDDLDVDLVAEFDDFLVEEDCPNRLKTGGEIIGKSRAQYYKYTKKRAV